MLDGLIVVFGLALLAGCAYGFLNAVVHLIREWRAGNRRYAFGGVLLLSTGGWFLLATWKALAGGGYLWLAGGLVGSLAGIAVAARMSPDPAKSEKQ